MTAGTLDISNVLSFLLKQADISESELSRKIGLPRATINRLVLGRTPDPRASTLNVIAQYFGVTVDQLLGLQPIVLNNNSQPISDTQISIPIIPWNELTKLDNLLNKIKSENHHDWIMIDSSIDEGRFALRIHGESMWPQFQEDSILIINTVKKLKNRDFVIAYIKDSDEVLFRQLLIENQYMFLKPINNIFPTIRVQDSDKFLGIVVQVRKNY